ncbi:MAG: metalloregulator ArsR/SmtB family transcription factor [Rhodobacteraceae bacterium]|jgi:ArsR family transcriptional regulator, arsenate/arsenite/antimonite-responsive transcriptional repressor|nr:metalloregulator ArsR/SmtB family transcription factor [Paracoccaceae bacterium]
MDQSKALVALQALANPQRLALIRHLMGVQGHAAGTLAGCLGISASALSFHLATLEGAGLIRSRRDGRQVIYSVDRAIMGGLIGHLLNDCCLGDAEVKACCMAKRDLAMPTLSATPAEE